MGLSQPALILWIPATVCLSSSAAYTAVLGLTRSLPGTLMFDEEEKDGKFLHMSLGAGQEESFVINTLQFSQLTSF